MPYPDLTDEEYTRLKEIYFPRRSAAERFTDAVLVAWLIGFSGVLAITGYWILRGGKLP